MTFTYAAGVITQTGTDTSLAGLNGLTGVTRTMSDLDAGASNKYTLWTINSATQLRVQGTLTWDPDQETLLMEKTPSNVNTSAPLYLNGGTINFGVTRTGNSRTIYSKSCGLQFTKQGTNFFQYWALYADATSTFNWNGGVIRSAATLMFDDGATLTINNGTFFSSHPTDAVQIRCQPSNTTNSNKINVYNLTLDGAVNSSRLFTTYNFGTAVFTMHRADFQRYNNSGSVPNTLLNLNNASNINTYDVEMSQTSVDRVKTTKVQNNAAIVVTGGAAARYGYVEVYRQLACPVVDLNGSGISYSYYGKDTNNGSRVASPSTTDPQNKTADQVYSGLNVTGNLTNNILTQTAANTNGVVTSDLRWDSNGEIPIKVIGYTTGITIFKPVLIGLGSNTEKAIMVPDVLVTQSTKATVDAYTGYETPQKAYDGAKALLCDGYAGQTSMYISRVGAQLDFTNALATAIVFNSAAGAKIAYASNTITYRHASDYTGGCTGTGSFTISGAQGLSGGLFDNSGGVVYSSSKTSITGITVTGTLNITVAGTYTLTNCTIGTVVNSSGGSVTIRAINSTITNNSGPNISIQYYSAISHAVKVGATPVSGAIVGYWDDTNTDRTYSASFVQGALTSDGSGVVSGYVRYRLDGTTYTGINVHVGKPGYIKYKVPTTPTGAAISSDILIVADSAYLATPSTGTTVNFGTSTITQAGAATTDGIYDYYIQQWFTVTNLYRDQIFSAQGANFAVASGADFILSSGALTGMALTDSVGAQIHVNGGTASCGINVVGQLFAASPSVLTGPVNMQGGTLDLANLTTYQMSGSFAEGTIDLDSISAPTSTTLDLRNVTALGAALTVKNDSNTNLSVRLSPGQPAPTLDTTGPGTGTLTLLSGIDVTAPNLINGTRVRLYNVTAAVEIDNSLVSGGGGYSYPLDALTEFTNGDVIRLSYEYQSGVTAKLGGSSQQTATTVDIVFSDTQANDAVYNANAIDGSAVTGLATDFASIEIDINDPDNFAEIESIYAWFVHIKSTADGIRNWPGGIVAEDAANYRINTATVNLKLQNAGPSGLVLRSATLGLAARLYRDDGTSIWAVASNGASADHGRVVLAQTADIAAIKNLVEADEVHTATQVTKLLKGTATVLLTKNHSGTPLTSFQAVQP